MLRGVNLGGDSKIPVRPAGATHLREGFYRRQGASFVGRPFPLEEADEHFDRLRRWGMNFLRFLVTWEAVEHDGPGVYDEAYLDYLEKIAAKAGEYGLSLFVDPHQDVWSRWTGGDGAPIWTLEAAGFEPERLHASGAALVHQEQGDPFPRMIWDANYNRLGCATMFTLFYGGDTFAPGVAGPDGSSLQGFLQERFIAAMEKVAARLAPFDHVAGFDSLNEPSAGFIGLTDLSRLERALSKVGPMPTPWEAMLAGSGFPVDVDIYGVKGLGQGVVGRRRLGSSGIRAWKDGVDCLWMRAGVWEVEEGKPRLRDPRRFAEISGRAVDFSQDFLLPFARRFIGRMRSVSEGARRFALFVEGVPEGGRPAWKKTPDDGPVVNATHWYDGLTLFSKIWTGFLAYDTETGRVHVGRRRARRHFEEALRRIKDHARDAMGGMPTLLGEFGLPFDLNWRRAYRKKGDYRVHERALAAYYDALDANLLDATLWNYSAGNTHERGDLWNGEDLSVFCRDEADSGRSETGDPRDSGGRALRGFVRPFARSIAGEPLDMRFDRRRGYFHFRYLPDHAVSAPTEIFVPRPHFPHGFHVDTEGGRIDISSKDSLVLIWADDDAREVVVRITRS
jgi:hypothetical protein